MEINPPLFDDGKRLVPNPLVNEAFILYRPGIKCAFDKSSALPSFRGVLYLTNRRCIVVKDTAQKHINDSPPTIVSLSIKLDQVNEEPSFQQPIFGANYLTFKVLSTEIYMSFMDGGVGTFLPVFYGTLKSCELSSYREVPFADKVYRDSTDPSTFYVIQPTAPVG